MYLMIFTEYDDDYKNLNNRDHFLYFKSKNEAEINGVDMLYEYIKDYIEENDIDNVILKQRNEYSINNYYELLKIIDTTYIHYKYNFQIKEIELSN